MPTVVEMPRLSDTMQEGTIARWIKSIGDAIESGDELAEVETDKAVMTFESFDDGVLLATIIGEGDTVPLGAPICVLGEEGEDVSALVEELNTKLAEILANANAEEAPEELEPAPEPTPVTVTETSAAPHPEPIAVPTTEAEPAAAQPSMPLEAPVDDDGIRVKVSPLARRIATERGIDLRKVAGSGPHGRIIKRDVENLGPTRRVRGGGVASGPPKADESIRVTQMRKTIASRLVDAKQSAPHFYLEVTCDASKLVELRGDLNEAQDEQRLSFNDLVMRACVVTLLDHPDVNAAWEKNTIRRFGSVHLGFAVAVDAGLISPVIRQAEQLDIFQMAAKTRELASRARDNALESAEYTGNSFCISNLGMFGIESFTAIINPPAACILAVGALRDAPVVKQGEVVAGKVMTLTLSCDHRVVDGAMGAQFLRDLKQVIEHPIKLIL